MKRQLTASLAILMLMATACGDSPVTSPVLPVQRSADLLSDSLGTVELLGGITTTTTSSTDLYPKQEKLARYLYGKPTYSGRSVSAMIGIEGGSLAIGHFRVDVPAGAVLLPTRFSITTPNSNLAVAEFEPHGTTFLLPVTLTLPYRGTSAEGDSTPRILWLDRVDWTGFPATFTTDGRIQIRTNHFSTWGTEEPSTDPSKGIIVVGG